MDLFACELRRREEKTAKLHGVDPTLYLTEAVRAADRGETLFPWHMQPTT